MSFHPFLIGGLGVLAENILYTAPQAAPHRTVGSMTALRGLPGSAVPVRMTGYYAAGDGGGGDFYWDADETSADNGGSIILPTGHVTAGRWRRQFPGKVALVEHYGAQPGVDVGPAFRAAIDDLGSAVHTILFAGASYVLSTPVDKVVPSGSTIDFGGAVIGCQLNDPNADLIKLYGHANKETPLIAGTLSADALRGTLAVTMADAAGVQVGDLLRLNSQEWFDEPEQTKRTYETNVVRAVEGNIVYLDRPLLCDFTSAGDTSGGGTGVIAVEVYRPATGVKIAGGDWRIDDGTLTAMRLFGFSGLRTQHITMQASWRYGLYISACAYDVHQSLQFYAPGSVEPTGNYASPTSEWGYGITHTHSCGSLVKNSYGGRGWHAFEAADGVRDVTYEHCTGMSDTYAFSTHRNCVSVAYQSCRIEGKSGITCRARHLRVQNCLIQATTVNGIAIETSTLDAVIDNNIFECFGSTLPIFTASRSGSTGNGKYSVRLTDNYFKDLKATISVGASDYFYIEGNTFEIKPGNSASISASAAISGSVRGNTFVNQPSTWLVLNGIGTGVITVAKNTVLGTNLVGTTRFIQSNGGAFIIDGNLLEANSLNLIRCPTDTTIKMLSNNTMLQAGHLVRADVGFTVTIDHSVGNYTANQKFFDAQGTITVSSSNLDVNKKDKQISATLREAATSVATVNGTIAITDGVGVNIIGYIPLYASKT